METKDLCPRDEAVVDRVKEALSLANLYPDQYEEIVHSMQLRLKSRGFEVPELEWEGAK